MAVTSLIAVVALRTGKIIKSVFERGDNLLQKVYFVYIYVKSIVRNHVTKVRIYTDKKLDFSKRGLALKGLKDICARKLK